MDELLKYNSTIKELAMKYSLWDYTVVTRDPCDDEDFNFQKRGYEFHNWMICEDGSLIIYDYAN